MFFQGYLFIFVVIFSLFPRSFDFLFHFIFIYLNKWTIPQTLVSSMVGLSSSHGVNPYSRYTHWWFVYKTFASSSSYLRYQNVISFAFSCVFLTLDGSCLKFYCKRYLFGIALLGSIIQIR